MTTTTSKYIMPAPIFMPEDLIEWGLVVALLVACLGRAMGAGVRLMWAAAARAARVADMREDTHG